MKHLLLVLAVIFLVYPVFGAIDSSEVAAVREKAVAASAQVSESDKAVISKFWRSGLDRMFLAEETQEVVDVRRQLKEQKGKDNLSFYATAYIDEAVKDIQISLETVERIENPARKVLVDRNLMILVAELENAKLCPLALARAGDKDEVVRYWATKALTQPAVTEQLTRGVTPDAKMTETILTALKERVAVETRPEIAEMIVVFAGSTDHAVSREILTSLADKRIEAYKNWTIKNEQLDVALLNALGGIASVQQGDVKSVFGRKFAELYACVLQRYMKGKTVLPAETMTQLVTVIVEVDQSCLDKTLQIKTGILQSVKRNNTGLDREYETLLGNRMMAGELAAKLRFDYGKDASGKALTAPPELGPLPETAEAVASK